MSKVADTAPVPPHFFCLLVIVITFLLKQESTRRGPHLRVFRQKLLTLAGKSLFPCTLEIPRAEPPQQPFLNCCVASSDFLPALLPGPPPPSFLLKALFLQSPFPSLFTPYLTFLPSFLNSVVRSVLSPSPSVFLNPTHLCLSDPPPTNRSHS